MKRTEDKNDNGEPRYYVVVDADDDCRMPTQPEPVPLSEVGAHIAAFLGRYEAQGHYTNARQVRLPLDRLLFTLEPDAQSYAWRRTMSHLDAARAERFVTGALSADNVVRSDADGGL